MAKDRSNWKVRTVSFAEAEELDNQYYASLSEVERLEILMELRSLVDPGVERIHKVVFKKSFLEEGI